jgi:hypothetical protein
VISRREWTEDSKDTAKIRSEVMAVLRPSIASLANPEIKLLAEIRGGHTS